MAVAMNFQHIPGCQCEVEGAPYDNARDPRCVDWDKIMRRWLDWHDAKVRHEHGERIARAQEASLDRLRSGEYGELNAGERAALLIVGNLAGTARDLSPPP